MRRSGRGSPSRSASTVEQAAYAILAVANEHMVSAIRDITINEGLDPRDVGHRRRRRSGRPRDRAGSPRSSAARACSSRATAAALSRLRRPALGRRHRVQRQPPRGHEPLRPRRGQRGARRSSTLSWTSSSSACGSPRTRAGKSSSSRRATRTRSGSSTLPLETPRFADDGGRRGDGRGLPRRARAGIRGQRTGPARRVRVLEGTRDRRLCRSPRCGGSTAERERARRRPPPARLVPARRRPPTRRSIRRVARGRSARRAGRRSSRSRRRRSSSIRGWALSVGSTGRLPARAERRRPVTLARAQHVRPDPARRAGEPLRRRSAAR